ncbi:hypothetical protein TCAL_06107 [Tigriopus californicus]|uniref:Gustatory receptor n=1 Tax=Tigriopus californicus TaxID=6832 RepID=A0A553P1E0_TIGCA|nr:hypothetical protein TCAL_06107 [Tigriopus californicus]
MAGPQSKFSSERQTTNMKFQGTKIFVLSEGDLGSNGKDDSLSGETGLSEDLDKGFVSPLLALKFNFRFNQYFGMFPAQISQDFMKLTLVPSLMIWTFMVKFFFIGLVTSLIYLWLTDQGYNFYDLWDRIFAYKNFSRTDYFAIISHYIFLMSSALVLYFFNLALPKELTNLNMVIKNLSAFLNDGFVIQNPPVKKMMIYRLSVCFLCTIASLVYLAGVHGIIRNPSFNSYDVLIVFLTVLAIYVENQNHMFSELLFLRYVRILDHHAQCLLSHIGQEHVSGFRNRECCYKRCEILREMYNAISTTFGNDLFVTVVILVISEVFGFYLLTTFLVFIPSSNEIWPFIAAYVLYALIPAIRLYVIIEGSENTSKYMKRIRAELRDMETNLICASGSNAEVAEIRRVRDMYDENYGFSASGFFYLNRSLLTSMFGSLATYLIVLLQFKISDINEVA